MVVVLMGVSGCGKTTVGMALARVWGCRFYDGDDFHPPENIAKMSQGIALNDDDRLPWLQRLNALIGEHLARGEMAVLACSALRRRYRDLLRAGNQGVRFVHLHGDFDLIRSRMQARPAHYMRAGLLRSQFEALETPGPEEALTVDISEPTEEIVGKIIREIGAPSH